jgi:hypothetical protein
MQESLYALSGRSNQQPPAGRDANTAAPSTSSGSNNGRSGKSAQKESRNPSNAQPLYMYGAYGLVWHGNVLKAGRRAVGSIERDATFPWMWRAKLPSGRLTDTVNLTRAKDYACATAIRLFDLTVPA